MTSSTPSPEVRICECEHPDSSHDEAGCTWVIAEPDGQEWTCSCPHFTGVSETSPEELRQAERDERESDVTGLMNP